MVAVVLVNTLTPKTVGLQKSHRFFLRGIMETSRYTIQFENNGKKYIYNTLSTAIAEINDDISNALASGNFSNVDEDFINALAESHFIVRDSNLEKYEYLFFYNSTRFNKSARSFYLNLIPSYSCNLACPYCYEGQSKQTTRISEENLYTIIKFYENHIHSSNGMINNAVIRFYGGEPLLNKDEIIKFAKETREISNKYNIHVRYDMATNFTCVDNEILQFIKEFNISIQVTIDGTKKSHDVRRITKDGKGTYDLIVQNLKKACDFGIKNNITIRINIDKNNLSEAEESINNIKCYSNYVYFGLLNEFEEYNDSFATHCVELKSYSSVLTQKLNPLLKKYGYSELVPFGKNSPCALVSENKFFIDDKLQVYKCEVIVNRDDTCVGVINKEGYFEPNLNYYQQMSVNPYNYKKCVDCKLLPLCSGGCPAKSYIHKKKHDGIFNDPFCEFTEQSLLDYLKYYLDNN